MKPDHPLATLYFATTSQVKFDQYQLIFAEHGIGLRRGTAVSTILVEPQFDIASPLGEIAIINHPLRQAARFVEKSGQVPYMVEDTMLVVGTLSSHFPDPSGLPGADTKSWWRNLGCEGLLRMIGKTCNREARFISQIGVYIGDGHYCFARADLDGSLAFSVRVSDSATADVPLSNPFYFHSIFVPTGCKVTLAEMSATQFKKYDYRRKCVENLVSKYPAICQPAAMQLLFEF
jgi:inosine/xanthosine triphosphate pyrophosphatase family protein